MAPLTPNPTDNYAPLKTPDVVEPRSAKRSSVSSWSSKHWYLGFAAQLLVVVCIGLYIFGQLAYAMPVYWSQFKGSITSWWGGRTDLVRPTYLFLFCVLPFLASMLLVEFLRNFSVRRLSARYLSKVAQVLRRKPSVGARVSPFSYGELLVLALLVVGNVLVFYYSYTRRYDKAKASAHKSKKAIKTSKYFEMVGNSLGFSCLFNMAFLFIPATRNAAWMELLNISYANGVKYHRWLGVLTVLSALAHCVTYYWMWIRDHKWTHEALPCFNCSLKEDEEGHDRWLAVFGELALLCFLAMAVSSVPYVRRKFYNAFYYVHHLALLAIVFIALHWGGAIWFILPTVFAYLVRRAIASSNALAAVKVVAFTPLSNSFVKLVVARSKRVNSDFKVGQFVYLNVPAISKLQWHPFTITSSPQTNATTLTVIMKALGDWTTEMTQYCAQCKHDNVLPTIYMDGYYGASLEMYDEYPTVCLIGGGIGVTPLFAILEDMVAKLSHHEAPAQRVFFVFTFRELALLEEIHPLLCRIKELDPQEQFFSFMFSISDVPTASRLDEKIDHERLYGTSNLTPTQYDNVSITRRPFAEPLRSRALKSLVFLTLFAVIVVVLAVLEYGGGKIEAHHEELWLLQNFVEIVLVFVCAVLVYCFVYAERHSLEPLVTTMGDKHAGDDFAAPLTPDLRLTDVQTFRDLVAQYGVAIGSRPDLQAVLRKVHDSNKEHTPSSTIGVFVSGPEALKHAVDVAAAALGSSKFDIHTEEFEL